MGRHCPRWLGVTTSFLLIACVHAHGHAQQTSQDTRCPAGTSDFGSGMVAIRASAAEEPKLKAAHATLSELLAPSSQEPYKSMSFFPHVSLIYGVQARHLATVGKSITAQLAAPGPRLLCFEDIIFWDNAEKQTTTVVLSVRDDRQWLASIHDHLEQIVHQPQHFAFHPHVTLGFFKLGERLSEVQQQKVWSAIGAACWTPSDIYWTDRCGREMGHVAWSADSKP